jgi:hypothetical protein
MSSYCILYESGKEAGCGMIYQTHFWVGEWKENAIQLLALRRAYCSNCYFN